ncbi:hypothetical protein ANCCEY_12740 [Ancylostoma ceylanicum]|uniref:Uncharacterized protein n=1 Tax=Ancylostoma ceylanicum TaxID=53326 RepID=A0A0D6LAE6_9BILA|nr:hypothetical protein ANCCEY_12740 [Ancylostoma ceylanicum]
MFTSLRNAISTSRRGTRDSTGSKDVHLTAKGDRGRYLHHRDLCDDCSDYGDMRQTLGERSDRCLLNDIDPSKLSSLICGHPAGRGTALLLQALRQQVTIAASCDYSQKALTWIIDNDVLQLKAKRNSALVRVLQADGVDSREQMARLINTLSSFTKGRQYFTGMPASHSIQLRFADSLAAAACNVLSRDTHGSRFSEGCRAMPAEELIFWCSVPEL